MLDLGRSETVLVQVFKQEQKLDLLDNEAGLKLLSFMNYNVYITII